MWQRLYTQIKINSYHKIQCVCCFQKVCIDLSMFLKLAIKYNTITNQNYCWSHCCCVGCCIGLVGRTAVGSAESSGDIPTGSHYNCTQPGVCVVRRWNRCDGTVGKERTETPHLTERLVHVLFQIILLSQIENKIINRNPKQ